MAPENADGRFFLFSQRSLLISLSGYIFFSYNNAIEGVSSLIFIVNREVASRWER